MNPENEELYNQVVRDIDKWMVLLEQTRLNMTQSDHRKIVKIPFMIPRLVKDHKKADAAIIKLEKTTRDISQFTQHAA